jgi:hypothetical protein
VEALTRIARAHRLRLFFDAAHVRDSPAIAAKLAETTAAWAPTTSL